MAWFAVVPPAQSRLGLTRKVGTSFLAPMPCMRTSKSPAPNTPKKASYQFFNAAVDSVLVKDSFPGYDPVTSRIQLGFYGVPLVVHNYSHLDIFRSLHVAAQPRSWLAISQSPQAYICFANLAEIVFRGGSEGLINQTGITNCKQVMRACFQASMNNSRARRAGATTNAIKTPVVRVIMPKGLGYEWAFQRRPIRHGIG
ncbi:hypothetical protein DID88_007501 [Monilinia fructigena]|uniref:Uncharacterized protein n=1 Tax=Monilinia fructigena TaxID=38457 RepID=A0A395J3J5_9HELO|nr:hypothetical protein DID88_007501 [Monilinia fructigena]